MIQNGVKGRYKGKKCVPKRLKQMVLGTGCVFATENTQTSLIFFSNGNGNKFIIKSSGLGEPGRRISLDEFYRGFSLSSAQGISSTPE